MFAGAESDCDVINVLWQKHNLEMFPYVFQLCDYYQELNQCIVSA